MSTHVTEDEEETKFKDGDKVLDARGRALSSRWKGWAPEEGETLLGSGTYGVVVKSHSNPEMVVKRCNIKRVDIAEAIPFTREVTVLRGVAKAGGHPNVVALAEVGHYTLTLPNRGNPIDDYVETFSDSDALMATQEVVSALFFLHTQCSTAHRDLTPRNILFSPGTKKTCIIDFGMTKPFPNLFKFSSRHYNTAVTCAADTRAPEILMGFTGICAYRADIFSLGVCILSIWRALPKIPSYSDWCIYLVWETLLGRVSFAGDAPVLDEWGKKCVKPASYPFFKGSPGEYKIQWFREHMVPKEVRGKTAADLEGLKRLARASPPLHDFTMRCLRMGARDRPSTEALLDHSFVKTSTRIHPRLWAWRDTPRDPMQVWYAPVTPNPVLCPVTSVARERIFNLSRMGVPAVFFMAVTLAKAYVEACGTMGSMTTEDLCVASVFLASGFHMEFPLELDESWNNAAKILRALNYDLSFAVFTGYTALCTTLTRFGMTEVTCTRGTFCSKCTILKHLCRLYVAHPSPSPPEAVLWAVVETGKGLESGPPLDALTKMAETLERELIPLQGVEGKLRRTMQKYSTRVTRAVAYMGGTSRSKTFRTSNACYYGELWK